MDEVEGEPEIQHVPIPAYRFLFVLPEPLPFPDGDRYYDTIGDQPDAVPRDDDPWVSLTFYQESSNRGRTAGSFEALTKVLNRVPGLNEDPQHNDEQKGEGPSGLDIAYTVVDAVTPSHSPDPSPDEVERAQDLPPRADAFNRCLRFVSDLARAYRVTTGALLMTPTYERTPHPVFAYEGEAAMFVTDEDPPFVVIAVSEGGWGEPGLMALEHFNLPDQVLHDTIDEERRGKFNHWMTQLRHGNPFMQWNELYLDARRLLYAEGEYQAAVVSALTASEVFLDGLLALLLWESGDDPEQAAKLFEEGKVTKRVKTDLPRLLGGNWQLDGKAVPAQWFHQAVRLRHRVVHGGYRPTRLEAIAALDVALAMERYALSRLITRRGQFPRATLMTVAESGLRARNLWAGAIKRFSEQVTDTEPSWMESFAEWRERMVAAPPNAT